MFYILESVCSDYALAGTLATLGRIFSIVCIVVPIILIVALTLALISNMLNPDKKNGLKSILTKFLAALIIFFLPTVVNLVTNFFTLVSKENTTLYNVGACWQEALATDEVIRNTPFPTYNSSSFHDLMSDFEAVEDFKAATQVVVNTAANVLSGMPIYYQGDYPTVKLGNSTIALGGCGFTCGAMVASYLTGKSITPDQVVNEMGQPYYVNGAGMSWAFPKALADYYGLGEVVSTTNPELVISALKAGQPVMCSQRPGLFTRSGHIIVLSGITKDGKILVQDPNQYNAITKDYNNRAFDMYKEIHPTAAMYWIFEQKKV